jgi:hypothetical protein
MLTFGHELWLRLLAPIEITTCPMHSRSDIDARRTSCP